MFANFKSAGFALAAGTLAMTSPVAAAPASHAAAWNNSAVHAAPYGDMVFEHGRKKHNRDNRYYGQSYNPQYSSYNAQPVYRDTQVWQGNDGRYYCRKKDGTTGLLIGGAAGALLGREIAGRGGDRTLGAILGAAGGALLGREIERGGSSCR